MTAKLGRYGSRRPGGSTSPEFAAAEGLGCGAIWLGGDVRADGSAQGLVDT
jgi:hypothetical protein